MFKYIKITFLTLILSTLFIASCNNNTESSTAYNFKLMVDSVRSHSQAYGKDTSYYIFLNKADSIYRNYLINNEIDSSYIRSAYVLIEEKSESNPKEAMKDLFDLSVIAKDMNLIESYGLIINTRARLLFKFGLYDESIPLFLESAKIIKENKDWHAYAYALMDIGNTYYAQKVFDMAIKYYDLAKIEFLKFKKPHDKYYGLALYENNRALVLIDIAEPEEAEVHFRNGLANRKKYGGENLYSNSYYYIARTKEYLGQEDSLVYYMKMAMLTDSALNLVNERINSTRNYAYYLAQVAKEAEKSFHYYKQALALSNKYKIDQHIAVIHLGIGGYYYRKYNLDSAIYYTKKAESLAILHGPTYTQKSALKFLKILYTAANDCENINKVLVKMMELQPQKNISNDILKTQISYEFEQKQNEIVLREVDKRKHRVVNILIGAIAALFLLYAILLIRNRKKLNEQSKKLKKALQAETQLKLFQEDMTNMIIHDLKNPLSTIINVKYLAESELGLKLVQQSGNQMNNLIMNLLDVYKFNNSEIKINLEELNLKTIIESALSQVDFLTSQKDINFNYNKDINCLINLDKEIIIRVLVNLMTNALKYAPKGSTIDIKINKLSDTEIKFSIINSGPHIPKELQEQIFERFVHSEDNSTTGLRSTGLGLTYCKIAIEGHNGNIGVNSEPNKDVEFWFTLPGLIEFS